MRVRYRFIEQSFTVWLEDQINIVLDFLTSVIGGVKRDIISKSINSVIYLHKFTDIT